MTARTHFVSQQWTRLEDDSLRSLAASGRSARSIAIQLRRPLLSVKSRAAKLKIRFVKRCSQSDHESLTTGSIAQLVHRQDGPKAKGK
jgi:hypothetical protein